jgi:alpha-D-ribose 1-methylphosphonate 5-triphosphate synthase subunit PhnG
MTTATNPERANCFAVLADAPTAALEQALHSVDLPDFTVLRQPETGLVMVRGRMGGTGRRFNVGEVTVTRCAVAIGDVIGHGYVRGRDRRKAELVALCDALLQTRATREALLAHVITPLERELAQRRALVASRAAATRVEFFTLVRGED